MQLPRALTLALIAALPACLEVEEEVVVRPDGSVHVQVAAEGDRADLEDGFPLPAWGAWRAADDATLAWLTGGSLAEDQPALRVEAEFRSVGELPSFFAPPSEPYRSAGLERRSELQVTRKGERTIYTFTRVLGARRYADWSPSAKIEAALDDELREALEAQRELTDEQWTRAAALVRAAYAQASRVQARSALSGVYVCGEADLSVDAFERILDRVERAVADSIHETRLRALYALTLQLGHRPPAEREATPPELDLDRVAREVVRAELPAALAQAGVAERVQNAVFEYLEWSFAALDQTSDLGDEKLSLRLSLPGRIVEGNFDGLEGGAAVWRIEGEALHDREIVLRAVSVLE